MAGAHLKSDFNYNWEVAMRTGNTTPEWQEKRNRKPPSVCCFFGISIPDKLKKLRLVSHRTELC
ncbi:hypothetical protein ACROYT_G026192 [Oculina patagonica]